MTKYCTMCGRLLGDASNALCDSCLAEREQAAASAVALPGDPADSAGMASVSHYVEWILAAFLRPEAAAARAVASKNALTGLIMAIANSLVVSLVALAFLHRAIGGIGSFLGGMSGMMAGEMLGRGNIYLNVHYGSIFFRMFLLLMLQWVLLSYALTLATRWFKEPLPAVSCLNLVGLSRIYFAAGSLIALIFSYLIPALSLFALGVSMLAGYLAIERGVRSQSGSSPFYLLPAALLLYMIGTIIAWKILF